MGSESQPQYQGLHAPNWASQVPYSLLSLYGEGMAAEILSDDNDDSSCHYGVFFMRQMQCKNLMCTALFHPRSDPVIDADTAPIIQMGKMLAQENNLLRD